MKKLLCAFFAFVMILTLFAGCAKEKQQDENQNEQEPSGEQQIEPAVSETEYPQLSGPSQGDQVAVIETSEGTIRAVLYPQYAPLAVQNFIDLANAGYYSDMLFHRVVQDFVIQTGDPTGSGSGGESASGEPFANEHSLSLHHFTGALGMANAGENLNKSQFYIVSGSTVSNDLISQMEAITDGSYPTEVINAYKELGGQPALDYRYTVFGQVYEGLDVVEKINKVKVDEDDRPASDVQLLSVTIETYSAQDTESEG